MHLVVTTLFKARVFFICQINRKWSFSIAILVCPGSLGCSCMRTMLWHFCVKINENLFVLCSSRASATRIPISNPPPLSTETMGKPSQLSSDFLLRFIRYVTLRFVATAVAVAPTKKQTKSPKKIEEPEI